MWRNNTKKLPDAPRWKEANSVRSEERAMTISRTGSRGQVELHYIEDHDRDQESTKIMAKEITDEG